MKRKGMIIALGVICAMTLGACGSSESAPASDADTQEDTEDKTKNEETKTEDTNEDFALFANEASIEPTTILDKDGLKVTATDISYYEDGAELTVEIENNSDKEMTFMSATYGYNVNAINHYAVNDGYLSVDVAAGESTTEKVSFASTYFEMYGMSELADLEYGVMAVDDNYDVEIESGPVEIKTSLYDGFDFDSYSLDNLYKSETLQTMLNTEVASYSEDIDHEQKAVSVLSESILTNVLDEKSVMVEVQNTGDEAEFICLSNVALNGVTSCSGSWTGYYVAPGNKAALAINLNDLINQQASNVTDVGEIEDVTTDLIVYSEDLNNTISSGTLSIDAGGSSSEATATQTDEIYNDHNIAISYQGIKEDDFTDNITLFVQNNSKSSIIVAGDDETLSINGTDVSGYVDFTTVEAGNTAAINVEISVYGEEDDSLQDISNWKQAEIGLKIMDEDSYKDIDTPILTIELNN